MLNMRAETQSSSEPNLWKGLPAGASGDLTASFAMNEVYSLVLGAESNSEPGKKAAGSEAAAPLVYGAVVESSGDRCELMRFDDLLLGRGAERKGSF
jgi:hypothetical protein